MSMADRSVSIGVIGTPSGIASLESQTPWRHVLHLGEAPPPTPSTKSSKSCFATPRSSPASTTLFGDQQPFRVARNEDFEGGTVVGDGWMGSRRPPQGKDRGDVLGSVSVLGFGDARGLRYGIAGRINSLNDSMQFTST
jgi:hypothetical protein